MAETTGSSQLSDILKAIIDKNISNEQFGVNELAAAAGMSRSTLHRKLQELTGQSVSQFIREYRLDRAMALLKTENVSAAEAAYQVGFNSASYFSKSFTDYFGFPPGEVKKGLHSKQKQPPNIFKQAGIPVAILVVGLILMFLWSGGEKQSGLQADKSIVVLPFSNLDAEEENQYFADGVTDAIRSKLTGITQLRVASRTSSERFRNSSKVIPDIASELNVSYILSGSARKVGSEIHVRTHLVDATGEKTLWSQEFSGTFEDVLSLQSDIAAKIAEELQAVLSMREQEELHTPPTYNSVAYDKYLLAKYQFRKWTYEGFNKAVPLYKEAIRLDPEFTDAFVGLGYLYETGGLVWGIFPQDTAAAYAKHYLGRALELQADNAAALTYLGSTYFYYDFNFDKAQELYDKAREILGGYRIIETTDFLIKMNQCREALVASDYLLGEDPLTSSHYYIKAEALFFLGDTVGATKMLDEALQIFDDIYILRESAKNYYLFGEYDKSSAALEKHLVLYPDRQPIINYLQAAHARRRGLNADTYIMALEYQFTHNISGSPAWFLALYNAEYGSPDEVFRWLNRSFDRREVEMTWLKMEPTLAPYRTDPRFSDLMKKMSFRI